MSPLSSGRVPMGCSCRMARGLVAARSGRLDIATGRSDWEGDSPPGRRLTKSEAAACAPAAGHENRVPIGVARRRSATDRRATVRRRTLMTRASLRRLDGRAGKVLQPLGPTRRFTAAPAAVHRLRLAHRARGPDACRCSTACSTTATQVLCARARGAVAAIEKSADVVVKVPAGVRRRGREFALTAADAMPPRKTYAGRTSIYGDDEVSENVSKRTRHDDPPPRALARAPRAPAASGSVEEARRRRRSWRSATSLRGTRANRNDADREMASVARARGTSSRRSLRGPQRGGAGGARLALRELNAAGRRRDGCDRSQASRGGPRWSRAGGARCAIRQDVGRRTRRTAAGLPTTERFGAPVIRTPRARAKTRARVVVSRCVQN